MKRPHILSSELLIGLLAIGLMGCDQNKSGGQAPSGQAAAVEVTTVTLAPQRLTVMTELPGRTAPFRVAEVRPQVGGVLLKRLFTEGGEVKAGQQLYQIDPAPYQAAYDSAAATLARAEALQKSAHVKVERYKPLVAANAIGRQDFDDAVAAEQQTAADAAAGRAAVETARINLVYTKVLSPISGRVGRSALTEGALVVTGQQSALATVQQLDPIYVDVTQSSVDMLRLQRELAAGHLKNVGEGQAETRLVLEDGSEYPEPGRLLFSEVTVDQGTGSVTLRAVFPNPKRLLLPGMFVHARVEEGVAEQALLVPQQGVTRNPAGDATALVVGADNKVEQRVLKVDRTVGDKWLVTDGVRAGDRVIVEGLQKIRPGATVKETPAGGPSSNQGASPTAR
ncbi:MAG: efflux RND transporter periplasmic adaptor subunit [Telmatospirillum sp.]|nr:efflux RND transporter periplasmic adaptor subunit [Telmatospirillum sp.]